ncbi:protein TonB [Thiothrix eikelboomii]|uniref:Protein TonB n=1 Tax=Thiothrix eikelboomii TaxID=92487 RepID=A0A1T4XHW3_9GAMM|nr:TonB family protein [Thiothrix eikelboomii]SKA88698.1 protein TonB [Thiothrix eikelboomii]
MNEAIYAPNHTPLMKTLPFALAVHAAIIFGISFAPLVLPRLAIPPALDITIVQLPSEETPKEVNFLAQANQEASGTEEEVNKPRSPLASSLSTDTGESPVPSEASTEDLQPKLEPQILTTKGNTFTELSKEPDQPDNPNQLIADITADSAREIAELLAEVDAAEAQYARRPRIHFIDAVSAKSAVEAAYIDSWIKKIERIGNINFPEEAIRRNMSGKLILNVTLDHAGRVVDSQIDVSSGFNILDKAALRIVNLASPYPPLPADIRKKWDQLNITRTWIFHSGTLNTE